MPRSSPASYGLAPETNGPGRDIRGHSFTLIRSAAVDHPGADGGAGGFVDVASVWAWGKAPALLSGFHTISCTKTATSVTLKLDAKSWTQKIAVGAINNTLPVSIGGKTNCKPAQCDFTSGSIDYATLQYQ
jgi:hypothetical protein